jgi:signal transduction histidine kinase
MTQAHFSQRHGRLIAGISLAILAGTAVIGVVNAPTAAVRGTTILLLLAFGVLLAASSLLELPRWAKHVYLLLQTCLVTALLYIHPDWTVFTLLFFVLSAQAMILLPVRLGAAWIAAFVLISVVFGLYRWGWPEGIVALLLYSGGYAMFGIFADALARADAVRRESQTLLAELQDAHRQLQEYAARVEELAVVEERNRLAREMHDTLGHRLTVASVQLEGAQRLCSKDPERAAGMVSAVRDEVREALGELRSTVATLRTPIEADLQLRSSLSRLAAHFEQAAGVTVHQVLPEEMRPLPDTHRLALYRAAQEALTNVQRHAGAEQVWLVLTAREDSVTLLVSDDGHGFSLSGEQTGFGLRGLRERAAQLDGELHVEPRPGRGTQVSLRLPLPVARSWRGQETGHSEEETGHSEGEALPGARSWHGQETGHSKEETGHSEEETGHSKEETGHSEGESGHSQGESGHSEVARSGDRPQQRRSLETGHSSREAGHNNGEPADG